MDNNQTQNPARTSVHQEAMSMVLVCGERLSQLESLFYAAVFLGANDTNPLKSAHVEALLALGQSVAGEQSTYAFDFYTENSGGRNEQ